MLLSSCSIFLCFSFSEFGEFFWGIFSYHSEWTAYTLDFFFPFSSSRLLCFLGLVAWFCTALLQFSLEHNASKLKGPIQVNGDEVLW